MWGSSAGSYLFIHSGFRSSDSHGSFIPSIFIYLLFIYFLFWKQQQRGKKAWVVIIP